MKFDNAQFLRATQQTMTAMASLNKSLQMQGATKGLQQIGAAAGQQTASLKNVEAGVNSIADRFKSMSVVAVTALATVANQAVFAGQRVLKSLTLDPIIKGFQEYELNINSIQTILANTTKEGTKLKDVTAVLDELNRYSDQTIYSFSEMAKNVGTFTAAGVKLKDSALAIKGIANLAALSGSNSNQASAAMYQLSQALSAGKVSLEDWNSVVNAGMGGQVFQDALKETARVHGVAIDQMIKDEGSFRLTLQNGWLTSDILSETLQKFTGNLNAAQLKSMGYNEQQIAGIMKMAKTATDAATKVKTFTQLINTLQEASGSGWAQTWKIIFGDFEEARTLFTRASDVLGGWVTSTAEARNKVLSDWKQMGGRAVVIEAITNAFNALISVVRPIGQAFRQIFPAVTAKQLYDLSVTIRDFTKNLILGKPAAENLRRTFAGFFAILGIGWDILKQVVKTILQLAGVAFEGSGGFLEFTAKVGDWLVNVRKAINDGGALVNIFKAIGAVLAVPIKLIKLAAGFLGSLFKDLDGGNAAKTIGAVSKKLEPLGRLGEVIAVVWAKVIGVLDNVGAKFAQLGAWASKFFGDFGKDIQELFADLDFGDVLAGLNTGLFAGLLLMLRNIIGGGGLGGVMENISEGFQNLTGALGAMQNTLRAATLLQIAAAVGILAIAMNTLSKIDAAGLARASAAITVMFAQLLGSLLLFEKFSGFTGFAKMPFVATSMILLGAAVNVLASAMAKLAGLSWEELAKGLTGTTLLLAALVGVGKLMPNPAGMITTATGMVILAAAIKVLVSAVSDLSGMSWEELAKGLVGVGVLLGALTLFSKFAMANASGALAGVGIVLLAAGVKILASAVQDMSGMSWTEIAKGLVTLAGALGVITAALAIIPPTAPLGAAAVLGVAISLGMVGRALEQMGQLSWGEIGKGLVAMLGAMTIISLAVSVIPPQAPIGAAAILITAIALKSVADVLDQMGAMDWGAIGKAMTALFGSLLLISAGVIAMSAAVSGAAALLIVAAALRIFVPVLQALGAMTWGEIGKGLLVLAAAFVVLGVAGALLTPVVPTLLGLGAAILLLGAGFALAGVGVLAFSAGLAALAISGAAGTAALVAMVTAMLGLLPAVAKAIGLAVIAFAEVIATAGPAVTKALVTVLSSLIDAIVKLAPKIVNALYKLMTELLKTMQKFVPQMVDAGLKLVVGILNGVAKNIGAVVTAGVNVIVAFLKGVSQNAPRVLNAGVSTVISFVNGLANTIRARSGEMRAAGLNLAMAIIDGMTGGLASGVGRLAAKAREIASSALNAAKDVLGIASPSKEFIKIGKYVVDGFVKGLDGNKASMDKAFNTLRGQLYTAMKNAEERVASLTKKLAKLQSARKKDNAEIRETKAALAQARLEQTRFGKAWDLMRKNLTDELSTMGKLANVYDSYTEKIKAAQSALEDAIKTRDDYNKSITEQYGDVPTAGADQTLGDFVESLRKQVADTKTFTNLLQRLRDMGLNDETYKDLLGAGLSALPFAQQLLDGGTAGITEINNLSDELKETAASLGKTASTQLYQAGVDAAQGLVDGLKQMQAAIEKQMDDIAAAMIRSIKKQLGIKSPSRVFKEIGGYSAEGLAEGLKDATGLVERAAEGVGDDAIIALRKTISGLRDQVGREMFDPMPTITPVLDLSEVRKGSRVLSGFFGDARLNTDVAYSQARSVASTIREQSESSDDTPPGGVTNNFTQNNYSPKALSNAEIYRQTKNQLSRAKGAVDPSAN